MRLRILGVPIDPLPIHEAVTRIVERAADPASPPAYVLKPYVEFFGARSTPEARSAIEGAWLCLADGVALQWAAAYERRPRHRLPDLAASLLAIPLSPATLSAVIPERVAGVTFTLRLLGACRERGLRVFLVGSPRHHPIGHTARHLRALLPGLRVVGTAPGDAGEAAETALVRSLVRQRPDVVLVGMGFPLQEGLMARTVRRIDHGVLVGEGGSFDYRELGGEVRRAPRSVRHLGLEWLWRLGREPWRLRRQMAIPEYVVRVHREARHLERRTSR